MLIPLRLPVPEFCARRLIGTFPIARRVLPQIDRNRVEVRSKVSFPRWKISCFHQYLRKFSKGWQVVGHIGKHVQPVLHQDVRKGVITMPLSTEYTSKTPDAAGRFQYSAAETGVWRDLFCQQMQRLTHHACRAHSTVRTKTLTSNRDDVR